MTSCIGDHFHHRCGLEDAFDDLCTKYLELRDEKGPVLAGHPAWHWYATAREFERENEELRADRNRVFRQKYELSAELDNLRANFDILNVKLNAFREENSALAHDIERLTATNAGLATENERYKRCQDYNVAQCDALQRKFNQLNSEYEGLRVSYEEMMQAFDEVSKRSLARGIELDELRAKVERLTEGVAATGDFTYSELRTAYVDFVRAFANIHNAIPREFRGGDQ